VGTNGRPQGTGGTVRSRQPAQRRSRQATPAAPGMRRAARQTAGPFW